MSNAPLLLVVDDETTILKTLKEALEDENYKVETLSDGSKTLDAIGKLIPDLVLLDIFMPNVNGLKLLKKINKEYPQQKIIIISGFGNIPIAIEAIKKGAIDFIEKPLNLDEILSKISFLKNDKTSPEKKKSKNLQQENLESYGIIGQSYLFLELMQQITQIANLKLPLLIYGQHGTGKTLITKYIHQKNQLKNEDFFIVNCSSLIEEKISEKIETIFTTQKGTLLVKNIESLNENGQKKLLNILEEDESKKVRIITTSSIPLFNLLSVGKFNSSLFHKLNITPIEVPPLNKRRYDIPLLVDHYLKKANQKYNKSILLNTKSLRILRNHDWTGNITELKAIIEKLVCSTFPNSNIITPQYLFNFLGEKKTQVIEEQSFLRFNSLKEATNEFEKNFLIFLLKKNQYDLKQVSDRLNLTPVQLRDKILKFNIEVKI